jgi:hypothetical protein
MNRYGSKASTFYMEYNIINANYPAQGYEYIV